MASKALSIFLVVFKLEYELLFFIRSEQLPCVYFIDKGFVYILCLNFVKGIT